MEVTDEMFKKGVDIVLELIQCEVSKIIDKERKRRSKKKRIWVRDWISRRPHLGLTATFLRETRKEDPYTYKNHLRMSPEKFDELLALVESKITKQDTFFREAIPAKTKLELVLRYLATGDSFKSLESAYRIPSSTISKFLTPVLISICDALNEYIKVPDAHSEWKQVANGFSSKWNFPNCCGAVDGKHIRIKCPPFSNSDFFNYKGFHSTILFAMVDSSYNFIYVDIGKNGRINDSTIFRESSLKDALENGSINFPNWGLILGDDAFPLNSYLMKPYSHHGPLADDERIFNYRLSRARRVVENAFGILASRFRIFLRAIELKPEKVDYIVRACCCLHNWLRQTDQRVYFPVGCVDHEDFETGQIIPGRWREEIQGRILESFRKSVSRNYSKAAAELRNKYKRFFMTTGAVDWQNKFIR